MEAEGTGRPPYDPSGQALYLQGKGRFVMGIDISPFAVQVAKARGLKKARVMRLSGLSFPADSFDTILMLGNNFALFGSTGATKRILKRMHRITSGGARTRRPSMPHTR